MVEQKEVEMKDDEKSQQKAERKRDHSRDQESEEESDDFYLRYYVGHKGKFGHEFLEFEFNSKGRLRYANNSQYKAENLIRKEGKCFC